ncbi:MAG: pseudaminic acid synthase [Gammaproteobacteria bacterium]
MNTRRMHVRNAQTRETAINGRVIGPDYPPYVVAELSANHNGSLSQALRLIDAVQQAGADAVKIQTYRPDTLTLRCDKPDFLIQDGLWAGRHLYDLYEEAHTPWEWHPTLFEHAHRRGITLFSSPFDATAVDLLESLNTPAYKVASFEIVDLPLIARIAQCRKPMLISTGMANDTEIAEALQCALDHGAESVTLLHCVSSYPAPSEDYNLRTLSDMQRRFGVPIGLSDHTSDNSVATAAIALGACVVEKHVTLSRQGGGPDDSFSLEPDEFACLCRDARRVWSALGRVTYARTNSEKQNNCFRRSLYFVKPLKAGDRIDASAIRSVRPGYGLAPKHQAALIGCTVNTSVDYGDPVTWSVIHSPPAQKDIKKAQDNVL